MALIPENQYAGQVVTGDAGYPRGKARNITVSGDGTGTPLEANWVNDIWGFFQAILAETSTVPTGTPDAVGASQYLDSIKTLIKAAAPRAILRVSFSSSWQTDYVWGDAASYTVDEGTDTDILRFNASTPLVASAVQSVALAGEVSASDSPVNNQTFRAYMEDVDTIAVKAFRRSDGVIRNHASFTGTSFGIVVFGVPA